MGWEVIGLILDFLFFAACGLAGFLIVILFCFAYASAVCQSEKSGGAE